jgi:hypothetical protein
VNYVSLNEEVKGKAMSETKPVAWRLRWIYPATGQATSWAATTDEYVAQQKERDGIEVDPLYPASAITSLMEENERLKAEREIGRAHV